ncbi:MAG TPA: hypothetical protein VEH29_07425 [Acidimicrobiales bacterium]|nr:hypothetical protein [Acidimicrobiales bacterium]
MSTQVKHEVGLGDVQHALSEALGSSYRVSAKSNTVLSVYRNPVIWGSVHVSWSGGNTTFRVRPGGVLLVMVLNALYLVPKVNHALERAFAQGS